MTLKDFADNMAKAFTTKEEGFSIKKTIFVVVVLALLIATFIYVNDDNWLLTLSAWLTFSSSLIVAGTVEKNITAVNETKQKANEKTEP